ncbi:MAG TPA: DUF5063 domain-containing protein [Bacteroidales bacterium]|nr:DUF5063 domain-containing protein [Bacteroidales bacterium]
MEDNTRQELLNNEMVSKFVTRAAEYCTFVENAGNFSKVDFVQKSIRLFSGIYADMANMPEIPNATESVNEKFVDENDWHRIYNQVNSKLGYHDDYVDVYDPVAKEDQDVSIVSLADNYADIYQDIKDFVTLYSRGNEEVMADALWECRMSFEEYWGPKMLSALRTLHRLHFSEEDLSDEEQATNQQPESGDEDDQESRGGWLFEKTREQYKKKDQ